MIFKVRHNYFKLLVWNSTTVYRLSRRAQYSEHFHTYCS